LLTFLCKVDTLVLGYHVARRELKLEVAVGLTSELDLLAVLWILARVHGLLFLELLDLLLSLLSLEFSLLTFLFALGFLVLVATSLLLGCFGFG
jgi:hypothetical protein